MSQTNLVYHSVSPHLLSKPMTHIRKMINNTLKSALNSVKYNQKFREKLTLIVVN
jgi:hypothetical protein